MDFGAGAGGPTIALTELVKLNGGSVEAIDSRPNLIQDMIDSGILPTDRAHHGDGLEFLSGTDSQDQYDLITAFMFGPDNTDGGLTNQLLDASQNALKAGGKLLITSDARTMPIVRGICNRPGINYNYITGVRLENGFMPDTIVASFNRKQY